MRLPVPNPLPPNAQVWGKTGSKLYGAKSGADYLDNHKRFCLFNKAAIEAVRLLPFGPGEKVIFVANDWHSALVPVLIRVRQVVPGWPGPRVGDRGSVCIGYVLSLRHGHLACHSWL